MSISRRSVVKSIAAGVGVAISGGFLRQYQEAFAAREKELNILCWEGYNSAQVLDPFRQRYSATVKAETL
jgi:spermidine/putrescine transport system substrate-binding protein